MSVKTKILIVEHDPNDLEMLEYELKKGGLNYVSKIVQNEQGYYDALVNFVPDIILADYTLPSFDGPKALKMREQIAPDTPFIFVSGTIGEENSIEYIKTGVTDYALKDKLFTLTTKIKRALKEANENQQKKKTALELAKSEKRLARAQQIAHMGSWELDFDSNIVLWSDEACRIYGLSTDQNQHTFETWLSFIHPDDLDFVVKKIHESQHSLCDFSFYCRIVLKKGVTRNIYSEGKPEFDSNGNACGLYGIAHDVTAMKLAEEQREFDRNNLNALINNTNDLMWSVDNNFKLITSNQPFINSLLLMSHEIKETENTEFSSQFQAEHLKRYKTYYQRAIAGQTFTEIEYTSMPVDFWAEISFQPIRRGTEVIGSACHSRNITERKKAEEGDRFKANLLNTIGQAVIATDMNGIVSFWNKAAEEIYGWSDVEAIGKYVIDLIPAQQSKEQSIEIMKELSNGRTWAGECMVHRKDGKIFPAFVTDSPVYDQHRELSGIIGVSSDITEQKKAYAEKENLLNILQKSLNEVYMFSADTFLFEYVNEEALRNTGFSMQEMARMTPLDINPEYSSETFMQLIVPLVDQEKEKIIFETIHKRADGSHYPVEVHMQLVINLELSVFLAVIMDITVRKEIEQRLASNQLRLKQAQALAHVGSWEIDIMHNSFLWSDELYKIFEINRKEFTLSPELFLSFVHPDDLIYVNGKIAEAFKTLENSSFDFRFIRNEGIIRFGYCEYRFDFDKNANPVRLFGIIQDVTERKVADLERVKIVNELLQRNKDLEQFAYIVSHNLRAPVANILGSSSLLNNPGLSAEVKYVLSRGINESVLKLDDVVKDLNQILQVKGGIIETKEVVIFSALVDDIKISIKNLIDKDQIQIKYDFSAMGEFFTLKSYLYSIFYNLISNSIKFRQVHIPCVIEIKSHQLKDRIELTFTDNGIGIDLEKKGGQIFGLYRRFHAHIEGKGMGLYMVKTQVEILGGKISIESELNKGTVFKIEF